MKLHGVHIDKALWEKCKSKTMKAEEIFLIRNIEQRRVVTEFVGAENIVKMNSWYARILQRIRNVINWTKGG